MPESTLIPNSCKVCGCWTATEVSRTKVGWALQRTHCSGMIHERGSDRAFSTFMTAIAHFQQRPTTLHPELATPTVRGALVALTPNAKSIRANEIQGAYT